MWGQTGRPWECLISTRTHSGQQLEVQTPWGMRTGLFLVPQARALCLRTDSLFFWNFNKAAPGMGCVVLELYQNDIKKILKWKFSGFCSPKKEKQPYLFFPRALSDNVSTVCWLAHNWAYPKELWMPTKQIIPQIIISKPKLWPTSQMPVEACPLLGVSHLNYGALWLHLVQL